MKRIYFKNILLSIVLGGTLLTDRSGSQQKTILALSDYVAAPIDFDEEETGSTTAKSSPIDDLLKEEKVLQDLVDRFLPKMMKAQEEKLGITYPREPVLREDILFSLAEDVLSSMIVSPAPLYNPEQYLLPHIDFSLPPTKNAKDLLYFVQKTVANYDSQTNTIYLHDWEYYKNYGKPACSSLENPCINELGFPLQYHHLKTKLDHELGHYFTDMLHESESVGSWPLFQDNESDKTKVCKLVISEGIAQYFEQEMNKDTNSIDTFKYSEWPADINEWKTRDVYFGGYHLVKPILDRYVEEGILYLITHLPDEADLKNLPAYQQKVLQELAKKQEGPH